MPLTLPALASLPPPLGPLFEQVDERLARIPTRLNEYGYDPFGLHPETAKHAFRLGAWLYRFYFRVDTRGIEHVPAGRVLLVANHAGNTLPMDAVLVSMALLLEAEPPRLCRSMAERYLPRIPWWNELIDRVGAVVGTPESCARLLDREEAILVFPEGARGFIKPYSQAYELQPFGSGFARLALQTKTPIVPVGIVGSEEQNPGLWDARPLARRLLGAPAFPITWTFPWLGPLGFLPLPVKYRLRFGAPLWLEGDPHEDDATIRRQVDRVRQRISGLVDEGLTARTSWFF